VWLGMVGIQTGLLLVEGGGGLYVEVCLIFGQRVKVDVRCRTNGNGETHFFVREKRKRKNLKKDPQGLPGMKRKKRELVKLTGSEKRTERMKKWPPPGKKQREVARST